MTPEQIEAIHEELRTMRAGHYAARWLLEDVVKAIQQAIDGQALSIDLIRQKMQEYADAALLVDRHAILATILAADDDLLLIEETAR